MTITLQTISSLLMVGFAWPHFVSLWSGRCGIVSARQNVSAIARLNKPAPDTEIPAARLVEQKPEHEQPRKENQLKADDDILHRCTSRGLLQPAGTTFL